MTHTTRRRTATGLALLALIPVACSDDSGPGASGSTSSVESRSTTTAKSPGTTGKAPATTAAPPKTVKPNQDALLNLTNASEKISFRGGTVTAGELAKVAAEPAVETPMRVVFAATTDKVLSDLARNQVRRIVAAAKDDRGDVPRADPFRVDKTPEGDVALMVIIDNPTDAPIADLSITAQLLAGGKTPAGSALFEIPDDVLATIGADEAAFVVLTVGKDRLDDPEMSLDGVGVRLDLVFSPA